MKKNFKLIMTWLAEYEGGYVNHPKDPGGATNRGVTQRVYDAYRKRNGFITQSVRNITDQEHDAIYLRQYWRPIRGDDLPDGLDASVFDMCVHSGASRAGKTLQACLRVKQDGVIGELTLAAVEDWRRRGDIALLITEFNDRRMGFLRRLKTFKTFGKGWTRRVVGQHEGVQTDDIGVVDRSVMLARNIKKPIPLPRGQVAGKADDRDIGSVGSLIELIMALIEGLFGNKKKGVA